MTVTFFNYLSFPSGFYTSSTYKYVNPLPAVGTGYTVGVYYTDPPNGNDSRYYGYIDYTNKQIQSINDISLATTIDVPIIQNANGIPSEPQILFNITVYPFLNGSNIVTNGGATYTSGSDTYTLISTQFPPSGPYIFYFSVTASTATATALIQ